MLYFAYNPLKLYFQATILKKNLMAKTTPKHTQVVSGWAALDSSGKITPYTFNRR